MRAYIRSLSCLTPHGLGFEPLAAALATRAPCPRRPSPVKIDQEPTLPAGGWIDPLSRPSAWLGKPARLGRLDRLSQLALLTAHHAVELSGGLPDDPRAGVALGTAHGCHLTNELFFAGMLREGYTGASPTLFAYTLPSSATGEIAIHLKLKGPTLTLCQGRGSALSALGLAGRLIEEGTSSWMLAGGVDTLAPGLLRSPRVDPDHLAEGAAFLVLSSEAEGALARIASYGMAFGQGALERATTSALEAAGTPRGQMPQEAMPREAMPREAIKTWIGPEADAPWRRVCGDTMGAESVLQLGMALAEGRPLPALVAATDAGGGVEVLCVMEP